MASKVQRALGPRANTSMPGSNFMAGDFAKNDLAPPSRLWQFALLAERATVTVGARSRVLPQSYLCLDVGRRDSLYFAGQLGVEQGRSSAASDLCFLVKAQRPTRCYSWQSVAPTALRDGTRQVFFFFFFLGLPFWFLSGCNATRHCPSLYAATLARSLHSFIFDGHIASQPVAVSLPDSRHCLAASSSLRKRW